MFDINDLISKEEVIGNLGGLKKQSNVFSDDRFWMMREGKSVIRLLPRLEAKAAYFVSYTHRYLLDGETIVADCLMTWGKKCPICSRSWEMNQSGIKEQTDISGEIYAKARYIYNAYIVNDPITPQNNGLVKLVSIGPKLHGYKRKGQDVPGLITTAFAAEDLGLDICNIENGFDLEIVRSGKNKDSDYSASRFRSKKYKICDFEKIRDQLYNIEEVFAKKEKTPEELKKIFYFIGFSNTITPKVVIKERADNKVDEEIKPKDIVKEKTSKVEMKKNIEVEKNQEKEVVSDGDNELNDEIDDILGDIE